MQYVVQAVFDVLGWAISLLRSNPKLVIGMAIAWYGIFTVLNEWRQIKIGSPKQRAAVASAVILIAIVAGTGFWHDADLFHKIGSLLLLAIACLVYLAIRLGGRFPSRGAWREMREEERLQLAYREGVKRSQGSDAVVGTPRRMGNGRVDVKVRTAKSIGSLAEASRDGSLGAQVNIASAAQGIPDGDQAKLTTVNRKANDPEGTATVTVLTTTNPLVGKKFWAPPIAGVTTDNHKRCWGEPLRLGDPSALGAPVQIGVNVLEEPVSVDTFENSIFISGLTRSGKSMQLTGIIRALAARPDTALILGDGAGKPDCFSWGPRASSIAIGSKAVHQQGLWLINEVYRRYTSLMNFDAAREGDWGVGQRKVVLGPDMPHLVVIWDEFGEVFKIGKFENEFHSIMTMALAAGVTIILATQRPDYTTVPARIRGAVPTAIGFATRDSDHTTMAFGTGRVPAHDKTKIATQAPYRGIGYTLHESSSDYQMFKSFYVEDEEIGATATATAHLRVELEGLDHLIENVTKKEQNESDW